MKPIRNLLALTAFCALACLVGCGGESKPTEVKSVGGSAGMAQRMADNPNIPAEQREKIKKGMAGR